MRGVGSLRRPMPAAWRRRLLRALRAVGIDAATAGPSSIIVSRRAAVALRKLAPGAVLAIESTPTPRAWLEVEQGLARNVAQRHVAALLAMYRVNCVLDVGAHRGQFGSSLRAAGYEGRIASFEPVAEAFDALRAAARHDPAWTVYPYALGRQDGTISMNVVPGTLSSVLPPTAFGARRYRRLRRPDVREVPVRRLDTVLDEVLAGVGTPRAYLKLDTQGYDLEVFAGLGARGADVVAMQSELALLEIYERMPRMPEALGLYEAAGFQVTALYPVSREMRTGRVLEFDCVMARADAV
jgi:FkbM family methyltransferase